MKEMLVGYYLAGFFLLAVYGMVGRYPPTLNNIVRVVFWPFVLFESVACIIEDVAYKDANLSSTYKLRKLE